MRAEKYKKKEKKFLDWFMEHASNFGGVDMGPSENMKPEDLESISLDMKGETPPAEILEVLDLAIQYRDASKDWYESTKSSTEEKRQAHARWLKA